MKAIIIISGFTQKNYQHTGSRHLHTAISLERDGEVAHGTKVFLKEWNTDWKSFAKYVNSLNPSEVLICAYSWGGGHGMPQLAKRLKAPVTCVLCDPVYRSKTILGRWAAFCDWKIKVPKNVSVVKHFIQKAKWWQLDGDLLKGGKSLCEPTLLEYTHTEMDDSPEYHKAALTAAKTFLQK